MKNLLSALSILVLSTTAGAETLECKARVLGTGCGSGNIVVNLNLENQTYESTVGAIACWGMDIESSGTVIVGKTKSYPYFGGTNYQIKEATTGEVFGDLVIENIDEKNLQAERVAIFDVKGFGKPRGNGPLLRNKFNLVCTPKL